MFLSYAPSKYYMCTVVSHLIQTPADHSNLFLVKGVLISSVFQNCKLFYNKLKSAIAISQIVLQIMN